MTYAQEVIVYHEHDLTLRTFLRQHFSYGRGAFWFHRIRARRGMGPVKVTRSVLPEPATLSVCSETRQARATDHGISGGLADRECGGVFLETLHAEPEKNSIHLINQ